MSRVKILEKKAFTCGRRKVTVCRQEVAGAEKPHRVVVRAQAKGITKKETWSYPSPGNPDCDFTQFDQAKADKFIEGLLKFLTTKMGVALANAGN